ncbi:hypothetical protein K8I61_03035 [bacterium]|nr:hypothetical protein [bacterium]
MAKSTASKDARQRRRRPAIHRSKAPSLVAPILAYALIAAAIGFAHGFRLVPDRPLALALAGASIAFAVFLPAFAVHHKLGHPFVRKALAIALPLWVAVTMFVLYKGIVFPDPVAAVELTRAEREATVELPAGPYWFYVRGRFVAQPEDDAKDAKKSHDWKGRFVVSLEDAARAERSETFGGTLESRVQYRRMSKKARGYVTDERLARLFRFRVGEAGEKRVSLTTLDETLEAPLDVRIIPRSVWYVPLLAFGLLLTVPLAFVDRVIRESREYSFFAQAMAATLGAAIYFRLTTAPDLHLKNLAVAIVVGTIFGVGVMALAEFFLRKPFYELNRKWRITVM